MKSDTATALSWLTLVVKAYQLFQPNGTPLVQTTLGTISAFSSAKLSSTVRQSGPKPTKTVGEEMLVPVTAPCGRTSHVAVEFGPAIHVHRVQLVICTDKVDACFPLVMGDGADHQAVARSVVVEGTDFVAVAGCVHWHRVVAHEMVVVEGDIKRAVIVVAADVHPTGGVHNHGSHPIRVRPSAFYGDSGEEAVVLVEHEVLLHDWQAGAAAGDDYLVAAEDTPSVVAIDGACHVRGQPYRGVEADDLPGILPIEIRAP